MKIKDLDTQNDQLLKDVSHFKAQSVSHTSTISSLEQEIDSWKGKQTEWQDRHKEQLGLIEGLEGQMESKESQMREAEEESALKA